MIMGIKEFLKNNSICFIWLFIGFLIIFLFALINSNFIQTDDIIGKATCLTADCKGECSCVNSKYDCSEEIIKSKECKSGLCCIEKKKIVKESITKKELQQIKQDIISPRQTTTPSTQLDHEDSPFGWQNPSFLANEITEAEDIGIRWGREIINYGFVTDYKNGRYNFKEYFAGKEGTIINYDQFFTEFADAKINPLVIIWTMGATGEESWAPLNEVEYSDWVKATVERYDGDEDLGCVVSVPDCYVVGDNMYPSQETIEALENVPIKYWEVENEPNFDDRLTTGYADLQRITYQAIKQADPEAKVLIGGCGGWTNQYSNEMFTEYFEPILGDLNGSCSEFCASGNYGDCNDNCMDIFNFHWYGCTDGDYKMIDTGRGEEVLDIVGDALEENGFNRSMPMWITEMNSPTGISLGSREEVVCEYTTETEQAGDYVKRHVYATKEGIDKLFGAMGIGENLWFHWEHYFSQSSLIYDGNGNYDLGPNVKKLSYYSYKQMTEKLEGSDWDNVQEVNNNIDNVYTYKLIKDEQPIYVVWWDYWEDDLLPLYHYYSADHTDNLVSTVAPNADDTWPLHSSYVTTWTPQVDLPIGYLEPDVSGIVPSGMKKLYHYYSNSHSDGRLDTIAPINNKHPINSHYLSYPSYYLGLIWETDWAGRKPIYEYYTSSTNDYSYWSMAPESGHLPNNPTVIFQRIIGYVNEAPTKEVSLNDLGLSGTYTVTEAVPHFENGLILQNSGETYPEFFDTFTTSNEDAILETRTAINYNTSDEGLVALYGFNGNLNDELGNNDLTAYSLTSNDEGIVGGTYEFAGSTSSYAISDYNTGISGNDPRTIAGWIYIDSKFPALLAAIGSDRRNAEFALSTAGNYLSVVGYYNDNTATTMPLELGNWYFLAATFDGTTLKAYVNDQKVIDMTESYNTVNNKIMIGRRQNWGTGTDGFVDEVRVYNRSLSEAEIQNLYELGSYHLELNDGQGKVNDAFTLTNVPVYIE